MKFFWSTSFANYQIQRFLMLGKKNRNAPHLNQPHCQWPCNHIHWYPCWCTWGVYKRIRFGHVFVSVGCICTHNVRFVKIYNIFINLLGNVMTSMNSKLLNFLRDELFIYTNCYGCDTIYIYHMARAFMAFADKCDVHNLKIRSHDLVFCVCSCRTPCHWVRDICRWYWNDKVSLLEVLLICTVTYKPIIKQTQDHVYNIYHYKFPTAALLIGWQ